MRASITSPAASRQRRIRRDVSAYHDACAADIERLATMLGAGLAPAAAWSYVTDPGLAEDFPSAGKVTEARAVRRSVFIRHPPKLLGASGLRSGSMPEQAAILAALGTGQDPAAALLSVGAAMRGTAGRRPAARHPDRGAIGMELSLPWARLAAVWSVSAQTGAPLAEGLRGLAMTLRERARLRRACDAEAEGPRSSARLVCSLPVVSTLLGEALGFPLLDALTGTRPGQVLLTVGLSLSAATALWIRAVVRRALHAPPESDVAFDLTAMALSAGLDPESARACATQTLTRSGVSVSAAADRDLRAALTLAARVGMIAHDLLRAEARSLRDRRSTDLQRAVARLGTRLLIPLGAGALPAFLCLGVAPMMLTLLRDSLGTITL